MKQTINSFLIALFILVSSGLDARAQDQVTLVNNVPGSATGLLVDGKSGNSNINDQTYLSSNNPIDIGQFTKANGQGQAGNEVIGFSPDRPMAIVTPIPWTTANNNVTVSFADKILIPITIWIVYGDFDSVRTKVLNDLLTTSNIYNLNNVGIDFSAVTFMNATANPLASNYYTYYTSNSTAAGMKANIGFVSGQINIYYVNMISNGVIQSTNAGQTNAIGGDLIAMGSASASTILVHELGHTFDLIHITPYTQWFDNSNVMSQTNTPGSQYFSEGQILRMHLEPTSAINDTYNARPGKLQRSCGTSTSSTSACPSIQKRIWADGTYPAN